MIFGGQEVESEGVMPVLQFYRGVNASTLWKIMKVKMVHPSTLNTSKWYVICREKKATTKKLNSKTRLTFLWTRNRRETEKQCEAK